jgi:hypothetical protein
MRIRLGRTIVVILGACAALLGGLWLLQGSGIVRLRPILCFTACEPVQGPSAVWAVIGGLMLAAGVAALAVAARRR